MGDWYKQWYDTTANGKKQMQTALDGDTDGSIRADIQKRLDELVTVTQPPLGNADRCHLSLEQRRFLEEMLNG